MRLRTALGTALAATTPTAAGATASAVADAADAFDRVSALATFTVWATDVHVRDDPADPAKCDAFPSPGNCPAVAGRLQPGQPFEAICRQQGEPVGGNPWWVYVTRGDSRGFIANHYVDNPGHELPRVPVCGT